MALQHEAGARFEEVRHVGLTSWLHEFEWRYARTFRTVALRADGIITGSPAIGRPRSLPPRSPWHGWRPVPAIGWISSRSFRPTGQLASYDTPRRASVRHSTAVALQAIGIVTGSPVFGRVLAFSRHIRHRDDGLWRAYTPGRFPSAPPAPDTSPDRVVRLAEFRQRRQQ
jgi:hypothetical protein